MTSFISLDIDYWANNSKKRSKQPDDVFKKILSLGKPIKVFEYHDQILPYLNKYNVDRLYQIDFHSDIADTYDGDLEENALNEGTWANFYKYKDTCDFEWRYPSFKICFQQRWGRCDLVDDWSPKYFPYKSISRKQGLLNIDWQSTQAVAIVLSRNWWNHHNMNSYIDKYSLLKYKRNIK